VAAGNAAALATAALEALGDPAAAQRASDAAKARFLERFSSERMTRETSAVYERLLVARNIEGKRV
jgi:glycosyltransferase involved in cell wall biosynthesis